MTNPLPTPTPTTPTPTPTWDPITRRYMCPCNYHLRFKDSIATEDGPVHGYVCENEPAPHYWGHNLKTGIWIEGYLIIS